MTDVTAMLARARQGDAGAAEALYAAVYAQLRGMAGRQVRLGQGGGFGATSLVHEAYLKLARADALQVQDREHFFSIAARAMRQIAIDRVRNLATAKRGGDAPLVSLGLAAAEAPDPARWQELLAVDAALTELEQFDARLARLVELRFYAGLSGEDAAAAMGLSPATAKRDWRKARAFLQLRLGEHGSAIADDA